MDHSRVPSPCGSWGGRCPRLGGAAVAVGIQRVLIVAQPLDDLVETDEGYVMVARHAEAAVQLGEERLVVVATLLTRAFVPLGQLPSNRLHERADLGGLD